MRSSMRAFRPPIRRRNDIQTKIVKIVGPGTHHRSSGPRWQSRYKAQMVEDLQYLDRLIIYIHLNPVVAGLVDDPADHPFSGHRELLGKVNQPLIDVNGVLAAFGNTVRNARRAYVRALKGARQEEWRGEKPGRFEWWRHEVDRPVEPVAPAAWVDELGRSTGTREAADEHRGISVTIQ